MSASRAETTFDDPVALAAELIAIDSVNPRLSPGAAGERAVAAWCAEWLTARGFAVESVGDASRPSLIARAGRAVGGRVLLLNGHLDTVAAAPELSERSAGTAPFIEGERLYGRGAYDMKSAVAALMVSASRAAATGPDGEVVLTLVADEEYGSAGTVEVLRTVHADGAVVAEPSGGEVVMAHRGFAWFELEILGTAAHGSLPEQGVDAIAHAARVLRALDRLGEVLAARGEHPLLQPGTVRVATIAGGSGAATVAERCTLTIERRFLPGETPESVESELRSVLDAAHREEPRIRASLRNLVARAGFEADPEAAITQAVLAAVAAVDGTPAAVRGEPFWTDAGLIAEAGIPVLLIGVDGGGPHADVEWADIASIHRLTAVLEHTIHAFCS